MTNEIWWIYSTFPQREEAFSVAQTLLNERLIACAHLQAEGLSLYRWKGALQQAQEVVLIAKTSQEKADAAIARIHALHSYEVPCVLAFPVAKGLAAFRQWVGEETA